MDYSSYINDQRNKIAQAQAASATAAQGTTAAKQNLEQFGATQKTAQDIYSGAEQAFNVGGARDTASKTREALNLTQGLISNLPNSVTGRTQGTLVNEAQRQRLLANELNPLQAQYQTGSSAYGEQQQQLQDLMTQAGAQAGREYQGQTDKYNQLKDLYGQAYAEQQAQQERQNSAQEMLNWYLGQQESVRQFNEQMAQQRAAAAESAAQARRQLQLTIDQANQQRTDAKSAEEKAAAMAAETERQKRIVAAQSRADADLAKVNAGTDWGAAAGGYLGDMWNAAGKFGPLALFGGGTLWGNKKIGSGGGGW